MQPSWQIPRPALFWLLATQVILAALQFAQLPLWLLAAGALVLGWRVQIYRGRWRYPGAVAKAALVGDIQPGQAMAFPELLPKFLFAVGRVDG